MKTKTIIPAIIVTLFLISCNSNLPVSPPVVIDTKPVWPQVGYDARNSFNRNAPKVFSPAVQDGILNWMYNPDSTSNAFGDGSESLVDSRGNFYHLVTTQPFGKIIKLDPAGNLLWQRDSLAVDGYFGIATSSDETKIYYSHMSGLAARDSSGNFLWRINASVYGIPVVNSDGNIYAELNRKPTLISEHGAILWQLNELNGGGSWPALDKEDNIIIGLADQAQDRFIYKLDKSGNVLWKYFTPYVQYVPITSAVLDVNSNIYYKYYSTLYSLTSNGELRWTREISAIAIPCITDINQIVCVTSNGIEILDTNNYSLAQISLPINPFRIDPYLRLDSENNIYFNYFPLGINYNIGSVNLNTLSWKWDFQSPATGYVLPGLVLSPNGTLLSTPKRPRVLINMK